MEITVAGAVRVNAPSITAKGNRVVAMSVDLRSKYAEVATYGDDDGVPIVMLGTNERTLDTDLTRSGVFTELQFPEYKGWSVFSAGVGRYTLRVCFVKPKRGQ